MSGFFTRSNLPGVPENVDLLLQDLTSRDSDPETYDACKKYLEEIIAACNECCESPLPLSEYEDDRNKFVAGFKAGQCKSSTKKCALQFLK